MPPGAIDGHVRVIGKIRGVTLDADFHAGGEGLARFATQLGMQTGQDVIGNPVVADARAGHGVNDAGEVLAL